MKVASKINIVENLLKLQVRPVLMHVKDLEFKCNVKINHRKL